MFLPIESSLFSLLYLFLYLNLYLFLSFLSLSLSHSSLAIILWVSTGPSSTHMERPWVGVLANSPCGDLRGQPASCEGMSLQMIAVFSFPIMLADTECCIDEPSYHILSKLRIHKQSKYCHWLKPLHFAVIFYWVKGTRPGVLMYWLHCRKRTSQTVKRCSFCISVIRYFT